jgi:hypothetical protein
MSRFFGAVHSCHRYHGDRCSVLERGRNFISTSGGSVWTFDDEDDGSRLEDSSCDMYQL